MLARVDSGALRIIICIFTLCLWFPISLYLFFLPYRIYMKEDESACIFYILSGLAVVFFFIWSIADFADANGWVMFGKMVTSFKGAAAFFSFFTAVFCSLITLLTAFNVYRFWRRDDS